MPRLLRPWTGPGDRGDECIHDYYTLLGPAEDSVAGFVISTPGAVHAAIRDFSAIWMGS